MATPERKSDKHVAESTLAEIRPQTWVDLRAVKSVRYEPGSYKIVFPGVDDPKPSIELLWEVGSIYLSEALQSTEENTFVLTLPNVRGPVNWSVPMPPAGQIPPAPEPPSAYANTQSGPHIEKQKAAQDRRVQAWEDYLNEWILPTEFAKDDRLEGTLSDEEELAYASIKFIQARRRDPEHEPGKTIIAELEVLAEQIRNRPSAPGAQS